MMNENNTIGDFIIAMLLSSRSSGSFRSILWERAKERRNFDRRTFSQNIYRLKKRGIISTDKEYIKLIKSDKFFISQVRVRNKKPIGTEKVLISFDIPETKKNTRDWLRKQLKDWEYKMIKKSLWLGKGPLPEEFYSHIRLLGIKENIKVFKISKKQ